MDEFKRWFFRLSEWERDGIEWCHGRDGVVTTNIIRGLMRLKEMGVETAVVVFDSGEKCGE